MSSRRMHDDELDIDLGLVSRLLAEQFPHWAQLPIARVASPGTDNAIFRLGADLAVRLPIHQSAEDAQKQSAWLPRLAPQLPAAVPVPVAVGVPDRDYPWHWSVVRWLPGNNSFAAPPGNLAAIAADLARFVAALHAIDAAGGLPAHAPAAGRGKPIRRRDAEVREAIEQLRTEIDASSATAAWEAALEAPDWEGRPVWIHGDLQATNLLVEGGRLTGVIDWGGLGVGDPAADLIPAWSMFSGKDREAYRAALAVDDATWARGKGWALSVGLIALPYYVHTNPAIMAWARRSVAAVLADDRAADR